MSLSLITPPAEEPVTVSELREHLRLESSDDSENVLLSGLIIGARQRVETLLRRQIITAAYDLFLDEFPYRRGGRWGAYQRNPVGGGSIGDIYDISAIYLPLPPLQSVTSVSYIDANEVTQVVAASNYIVDASSEPARIVPVSTFTWPTPGGRPNAVITRFVTGYGDASFVPENIKIAIKMLAAHWYENREEGSSIRIRENPIGIDALLDAERWGNYV